MVSMARFKMLTVAVGLLFGTTGCQTPALYHHWPGDLPPVIKSDDIARELSKVVLPTYRIAPPDVLSIESVRLVPNATYTLHSADVVRVAVHQQESGRIGPSDVLLIQVTGTPEGAPINGEYLVSEEGDVDLSGLWGTVSVAGLSIQEVRQRIEEHLSQNLTMPRVYVERITSGAEPIDLTLTIDLDGTVDMGRFGSLALAGLTSAEARTALHEHFQGYFEQPRISLSLLQTTLQQQLQGEHLVGPDGTVTLGAYGTVPVVGLSVDEAARQIESRLEKDFDSPDVAVTVFSFNSQHYYVIAEGAGFGDQAYRFPITGNDTVLDALTQINGLTEVSSSRMWIARASSVPGDCKILPVNWKRITSLGEADSNYQLLPGDRLFIAQDHLVAFDNSLGKITAPLERIMGFSLLGAETLSRFSGSVRGGGANQLNRF